MKIISKLMEWRAIISSALTDRLSVSQLWHGDFTDDIKWRECRLGTSAPGFIRSWTDVSGRLWWMRGSSAHTHSGLMFRRWCGSAKKRQLHARKRLHIGVICHENKKQDFFYRVNYILCEKLNRLFQESDTAELFFIHLGEKSSVCCFMPSSVWNLLRFFLTVWFEMWLLSIK